MSNQAFLELLEKKRKFGNKYGDKASEGYGVLYQEHPQYGTDGGVRVPYYTGYDGTKYRVDNGEPLSESYKRAVDIDVQRDMAPGQQLAGLPVTTAQDEIDAGKVAANVGAGFTPSIIGAQQAAITARTPSDPEPVVDTLRPLVETFTEPPSEGPDPGAIGRDEVRDSDGVIQKGTNTGVKGMNIPDMVRNPFPAPEMTQSMGDFGGNLGKIAGNPGDFADISGIKGDSADGARAIGANQGEYAAIDGKDTDSKTNWMEDQRSDNEMARRAAFLDSSLAGKGPMAVLRARDAAMGGVREVKDGRYTGNMLMKTADDDTTGTSVSKEQWSDYTNRGQAFLNDVMSGEINLGSDKSEIPGSKMIYDMDPQKFSAASEGFGFSSSKYPANSGVDFRGQQPYEDLPVSPEMMGDIRGNGQSSATPMSGALTHEQIAALPKIPGPNGQLVPDLRSFYQGIIR